MSTPTPSTYRPASPPSPDLLRMLETALVLASRQIGTWAPLSRIFREAHVVLDPETRALFLDLLHRKVMLEQVLSDRAALYLAAPAPIVPEAR